MIADSVRVMLERQRFAVRVVGDGEAGLDALLEDTFDAAVVDLVLPKRDGFSICRAAREEGIQTPLLILTARDAVEDRITGLDSGADDYLTKPFEFGELLARLRALFRRPNELRSPQIAVGDLTIDTASQTAKRGTRTISLTAKEYALLEFLARNAGRVVGRSEIAEHVWDETFDPFSNLIEVYVNRLRRKLGDDDKKPLLQTRRGSGYILGTPSDSRSSAPARAGGASVPSRKSHA